MGNLGSTRWLCAALAVSMLLGPDVARGQAEPDPVQTQAAPAPEPAQPAPAPEPAQAQTTSEPPASAPAAQNAEPRTQKRFALFRTACLDPALSELGAALDAVLYEELGAVGHLEVAARPSVDLPAMQLAIDCVGELPECMQAVTKQAGVDALVAPVLRGSPGEEVTVTLIYFEESTNEMKGVTRRLPGRNVAQAMLDAVPEMVREAFGLPPVAAAAPTEPPKELPATEEGDKRARRVRLWVPVTLGAVSLGMGAVGLGLGISANRAEDDYARAPTDTPEQIDDALATFDRAERRALWANVSFGVAGAALLGSLGVWLFTRDKPKDPGQVTVAPSVSQSRFLLSVQGGF